MSTFEDNDFQWRETYFVLFESKNHPKLADVERALRKLNKNYEIKNQRAERESLFGSLTIISPEDFAALDISYLDGEEVTEQVEQLIDELKPNAKSEEDKQRLARLKRCDARFDVLHFERVLSYGDDEEDEMLDPGALLVVMEALVKLCDGVAVDPQSGAFS